MHYYNNYNTYYNTGLDSFFAGMIVFIILICIICLILVLLKIIGLWKILKKANKPGWGALIPIYNQYLLCEITGVNPLWILIIFACVFLNFIPVVGSIASMASSIYFLILLNISLARSFSKDDSYAIGLILLQPIFYLMLGIDKSKYIGKNPMKDIIFNKENNSQQSIKYCTTCGNKIDINTKYCPNCGKEVN